MNKKAIITIRGIHQVEDNRDTIELVTEGNYYKKGNNYYIHYDESEISGMEGTSTTIKIEPERVVMLRRGENTARMVFEKGRKHAAEYYTPFGEMGVNVTSKKLKADFNESSGELYIKYVLDIDDRILSTNEIHVTVRGVN
ncbi:Uncharacterized beta-barrel protein YwiB, DUF1934 family [Caldanaerobius fijiensis DSM 17918]|uniref:Uncharacterized beta-barrel protein YwiB, DUF1934 family n=1 Tax=Caldanaerobius fijiensis DSM 17918 TaxID=1121256 RepID=A0A1M5AFX2_9THEO|nr:DUF1934 domain-containing protein [Caldanaerobius fijiensis]SHF29163.1 Uncharacterized beta-barrel protein YwiB, DUF1934 family [Caldanaerobius fijiensis DSM 17918]